MNEIENLKKIYDEKIQNLSKNTSDSNSNDNNNESAPAVAVDDSKYIEEIAQLNISLENQTRSVQRLELQLQEKDNEISSLTDNINSKSEENVTLNNDIIKLKEIISDRERALETSTTNFSELNKSSVYQSVNFKISF
jgi:chromosome segregation ATPase